MLSNPPPKRIDCKKLIAHIYLFVIQLITGIINTIKQVVEFILKHLQKYKKWIAEIIKYIKHLLCPNKNHPDRELKEFPNSQFADYVIQNNSELYR